MITSDIIKKFELYVDDTTELSTQEELDLANKIYDNIISDCAWEILKTEASGALSNANYVSLPSDFNRLSENTDFTENNWESESNTTPRAIFIGSGTAARPLKIINFSDRKQYMSRDGYAYLDLANSRITFTTPQQVGAAYSFDYLALPTALTLSTSPVFPERFHHAIYHGMAADDMIIQLFDKARSYAADNQAQYNAYLERMRMWNSGLRNN